MAELTESDLILKIDTINTAIDSIVTSLANGGAGGAANLPYTMGTKTVDGSKRLEQLLEARKTYQGLLEKIPKTIIRNHDYTVDHLTGWDRTEFIGDE